MRPRLGLFGWAMAWAYLLFEGIPQGEASLGAWLEAWTLEGFIAAGCLSFCASFGRVAEWVYLGGALWPFAFPDYALPIAAAILFLSTALQWGAWVGALLLRCARTLQERQYHRNLWLYEEEEEPIWDRSGRPLNRSAWRQLTPAAFEEETLDLFRVSGFAGALTPASGDEGIDLDLEWEGRPFAAQCKQYQKPVGQAPLRDFAGSLRAAGAEAGYFVTTSSFTEPAIRWVQSLNEDPLIILIDGEMLVQWAQGSRMPDESGRIERVESSS